MKKLMKKLGSLLAVITVVFSLAACQNAGDSVVTKDMKKADIFKTLDTVNLKGEKIDQKFFSNYKLTFVNVWNVGCTPCIEELSYLDALNKEYEEKGVAIRGLYFSQTPDITDEERSEINRILEEEGADFDQWTISTGLLNSDIFKNWSAFPGTFIVDSEGNILDKIDGSNSYEGWKEVIENAMKKAGI